MDSYHIPVLLKEAINLLGIRPGKKYIDATLGGGGHSFEIIKRGGYVLGIDCDSEAIDYAGKRLESVLRLRSGQACPLGVCQPGNRKLIKGNFKDILKIAQAQDFFPVSGILFDLGVSSHQLQTAERGFSFNLTGPLDMRMDKDLSVTAKDLVNALSLDELTILFRKFGEEFHSRSIAKAIIKARSQGPIESVNQLVQIIIRISGNRIGNSRLHPATRIFQALRICVNDELNNLKTSLPDAISLLENDGRLVVISFHSLEDRIVKEFFKKKASLSQLEILTKKPVTPTKEEILNNPRSRSAKLRAAKKIIN